MRSTNLAIPKVLGRSLACLSVVVAKHAVQHLLDERVRMTRTLAPASPVPALKRAGASVYGCVGMPGMRMREVLGVLDIDIAMSAVTENY